MSQLLIQLLSICCYSVQANIRSIRSAKHNRKGIPGPSKPERVFTNPSTRGARTAVVFAWKGRFSGREFYRDNYFNLNRYIEAFICSYIIETLGAQYLQNKKTFPKISSVFDVFL